MFGEEKILKSILKALELVPPFPSARWRFC